MLLVFQCSCHSGLIVVTNSTSPKRFGSIKTIKWLSNGEQVIGKIKKDIETCGSGWPYTHITNISQLAALLNRWRGRDKEVVRKEIYDAADAVGTIDYS